MMKELVEKFADQLSEALIIGESTTLTLNKNEIKNVLISGMGGSGIGGIIASEITSHESKIPVSVSDTYTIPEYINNESLVIVSSYSGDTEETLQSLAYALEKGAKIVCISSGGKLIQITKEKNLDHIVIPGGMPPRACVGYSLVQIFYILNFFGIIDDSFKNEIKATIELLKTEQQNIQNEAREVAKVLSQKLPIIYASYGYEGVLVNFRRQLNENAKMLCWYSILPEMNHNELVGWTKKDENLAVVFLRNDTDHKRIGKRMDIVKEIVSKYTPNIIEISSKGNSQIEKSLYLVHMGAWVSVFLAEMNNIDADEIEVIKYLKKELESFKE